MLLSETTYIAFKLQFYIWSALAFPGNWTHDHGVASAMLYHLSYRKVVLSVFVCCDCIWLLGCFECYAVARVFWSESCDVFKLFWLFLCCDCIWLLGCFKWLLGNSEWLLIFFDCFCIAMQLLGCFEWLLGNSG